MVCKKDPLHKFKLLCLRKIQLNTHNCVINNRVMKRCKIMYCTFKLTMLQNAEFV